MIAVMYMSVDMVVSHEVTLPLGNGVVEKHDLMLMILYDKVLVNALELFGKTRNCKVFSVVIADYEMLDAVHAVKIDRRVIREPACDIAYDIYVVTLADRFVPTADDRFLHFLYGGKGPFAKLHYRLFAEVKVGSIV